MKQATNLKDVRLPLPLPGIKVNTSATDYFPVKQAQLARFNGTYWVRFGDVIQLDGGLAMTAKCDGQATRACLASLSACALSTQFRAGR